MSNEMSNLMPPPPSIPPPVAPAEFLALQAIVMVLLQSHIVTSGFREPGVYLGQCRQRCPGRRTRALGQTHWQRRPAGWVKRGSGWYTSIKAEAVALGLPAQFARVTVVSNAPERKVVSQFEI